MTRRSLPAAGMLSLPFAVAVSALTLAVGAVGGPDAPSRVELDLVGVIPMPEETGCILVLREKGAKTILPLIVSGPGARELPQRLGARRAPGLLGATIEALGGRVREVELTAADEVVGGARVRLEQGPKQVEIEARPSESVALAIAAGAPIYTSRAVIEENGLTPAELARAGNRVSGGPAREVRL